MISAGLNVLACFYNDERDEFLALRSLLFETLTYIDMESLQESISPTVFCQAHTFEHIYY
jgi:hypothetical protein